MAGIAERQSRLSRRECEALKRRLENAEVDSAAKGFIEDWRPSVPQAMKAAKSQVGVCVFGKRKLGIPTLVAIGSVAKSGGSLLGTTHERFSFCIYLDLFFSSSYHGKKTVGMAIMDIN